MMIPMLLLMLAFSAAAVGKVDVDCYRIGSRSIAVTAECGEDLEGRVIFASYGADGILCGSNMQQIIPGGKNEYTFNGCAEDDVIKVFFWDSTDGMLSLEDSFEVNTAEVRAPDVLRVNSSGYLADAEGETVQLKGVNFGGWLIQETWMCPVLAFNGSVTVKNGKENAWGNLDTLDEMEKRFGKEETAALVKSYQDNYITERDFQKVKSMGFNCIRIPFWYRNFMSDENGTYITENDNDNPGFQKLDWACDMAEKYGLYLIFDMHGCPGGQNGDHSSGKAGRNMLYKQTQYQDIMEELWIRIAQRYRDRECVAAYDIMNEPFNNADAAHNVQSQYIANVWDNGDVNKLRVQVYDRMIKAIREKDPYHVITVEGIWRLYFLPEPSKYGWTNVMYQLHPYDSGDDTVNELLTDMDNRRRWYKVAGFVGEFNPAVYNKNIAAKMNEKGISYTMWNYKTAMPLNDSDWGLYHKNYSAAELADICGSAYNKAASSWDGVCYSLKNLTDDEIKTLYTNWWTAKYLSTDNFTLNTSLKAMIQ